MITGKLSIFSVHQRNVWQTTQCTGTVHFWVHSAFDITSLVVALIWTQRFAPKQVFQHTQWIVQCPLIWCMQPDGTVVSMTTNLINNPAYRIHTLLHFPYVSRQFWWHRETNLILIGDIISKYSRTLKLCFVILWRRNWLGDAPISLHLMYQLPTLSCLQHWLEKASIWRHSSWTGKLSVICNVEEFAELTR